MNQGEGADPMGEGLAEIVDSGKFSIDVDLNNQAICGWYAGADGQTTVSLYHRSLCLGTVACDQPRPDVVAAGYHADGTCGFSFPGGRYALQPGNIYKVVIANASARIEQWRLYGVQADWHSRFVVHELLPRHEYAYLASDTESVLAQSCDLIAYKNLMIRLRRGKRGVSGRGKFIGLDYPHAASDFTHFRFFSESLLPFWLEFLDARYLWSVVDTFADYGTAEERLGALAVSNYMYAERFFQSKHCIFDEVEKPDERKVFRPQLPYWGGMKTNQLAEDDAMDVFFTRNIEILACAPLIRRVFFELMRRSAAEADSGLGFNLAHSQYFRELFAVYEREHFS